jgi:predicted TIM-barrel fold metal-dependent hydrolase
VNAANVRRTHLQGLGNTSSLGEFNRLQFNQPRIFVACQTQDDLPYILQFGTEDNLMVGTDYTHNDVSAELLALDIVEERARHGEFSAEVARKIVEDNPGRFYGI